MPIVCSETALSRRSDGTSDGTTAWMPGWLMPTAVPRPSANTIASGTVMAPAEMTNAITVRTAAPPSEANMIMLRRSTRSKRAPAGSETKSAGMPRLKTTIAAWAALSLESSSTSHANANVWVPKTMK